MGRSGRDGAGEQAAGAPAPLRPRRWAGRRRSARPGEERPSAGGSGGGDHVTRVVLIAGTGPDAVKIAPLLLALRADPRFDARLVVTAQHREMLDQVLDAFGVSADVDLDLFAPGHSLAELTSRYVTALDATLAELRPDLVVVRGDTTTALCGALAGFYRAIPVAHLEAGLRTDDVRHPFPEEANRRLITTLATVHLAPTPANAARLHAEGVDPRAVAVTGNTAIDALFEVLRRRPPIATPGLQALLADPRPIVTVSALRRESWGQPIAEVAVAVAEIASRHDVQIVWPLQQQPCGQERRRRARRFASADHPTRPTPVRRLRPVARAVAPRAQRFGRRPGGVHRARRAGDRAARRDRANRSGRDRRVVPRRDRRGTDRRTRLGPVAP